MQPTYPRVASNVVRLQKCMQPSAQYSVPSQPSLSIRELPLYYLSFCRGVAFSEFEEIPVRAIRKDRLVCLWNQILECRHEAKPKHFILFGICDYEVRGN